MALTRGSFRRKEVIYKCICGKRLYPDVIKKLPNPKVCPFCGVEIKNEVQKET